MPEVRDIPLQPKQVQLLNLIKHDEAIVIGGGGGRGAAKSSGADRIALIRMHETPGLLCCILMRNADQVFRYHVEAMARDFDWASPLIKRSIPAYLRLENGSQCDFSYGESLEDIERRFRSGNYGLVLIDQAEQFSEEEIREIRKATRMKGGGIAKLVLLFNMRGAGIQTLRKWFDPSVAEFNPEENPNDYTFIKFNPWDNVEWVRAALAERGLTEYEYYQWTDDQRKEFAAKYGQYTKGLATDDAIIRKSDWEGSWESIEGTYFAHSFNLHSTRITPDIVDALRKPWSSQWIAQDWGTAHNCATYWAFRTTLAPSEAKKTLGWDLVKPINITVIHRECIVDGMDAPTVAQTIVDCTPLAERAKIRSFYLSPECVTGDPNCVGSQQGKVTRAYGMPYPAKADNDRVGGWSLMSALFKATKGQGWGTDKEGKRFQYDDAVFISVECAELLKTIPVLVHDPKNIDDVLKTDKGAAKIEQDAGDACRYLLKSMLAPRKMTENDKFQQEMEAAKSNPQKQMMIVWNKEFKKAKKQTRILPASWKGNLK